MNKYQAMIIFVGSTKDEILERILGTVIEEIEKFKGKVLKSDVIGKRMFARPMKKQESGVYVKLALELEATSIAPLLARFKLKDDVFRIQITRVDAEKVDAEPVAEVAVKQEDKPVAEAAVEKGA